jgi:hypothetical protein
MCGSKKTFTSSRSANVVARKYGQRVYRCSICKKYHLSSSYAGEPPLEGEDDGDSI